MSVYGTAHKLARAIKDSEEYQKFQEARKKIKEDSTRIELLQDFQQQIIKVRSKEMRGEEVSQEEKQRLNELQNLIEMNQPVKRFLQAQSRLSTMINDIEEILFGDLELRLLDEEQEEAEDDEGKADKAAGFDAGGDKTTGFDAGKDKAAGYNSEEDKPAENETFGEDGDKKSES